MVGSKVPTNSAADLSFRIRETDRAARSGCAERAWISECNGETEQHLVRTGILKLCHPGIAPGLKSV
jgi:hypothetical protein